MSKIEPILYILAALLVYGMLHLAHYLTRQKELNQLYVENRKEYERISLSDRLSFEEQFDITYQDFTCSLCPFTKTCPFAFDPYNTNGDCLAEK